jgi:hypothetical protein
LMLSSICVGNNRSKYSLFLLIFFILFFS